jgi:hypothetical protein
MTFKILTSTGKVIHRSVVRSATGSGAFRNRIADQAAKDDGITDSHPFATPVELGADSTHDVPANDDAFLTQIQYDILWAHREDASSRGISIPIIDTWSLLGRTFIDDRHAQIEEIIPTDQKSADQKHQLF